MKKRLLSALLALALVFVLLPTAALADTTPETDENVKINGTAVTVGNDISLGDGNGTYSYDKSTHTLTLNNATITATGSNIGISFGVPVKGNIDYKIELIGTNTISSTSAQAIYVEYDSGLDQQGTQKLSTLTINGPVNSQLSLNVSSKEAIWSKGDFTLSGGTAVTAFSSGEIAVNVGSMTINNSKLSAQSSSYGTTVVLYGFEMIGDAAEFEALNTSSGVRAVLRTSGASENIDWSKYQLITGSYSGNALTKSEPTVCDKNTLNKLFSSSSTTRYIHIAKRTIPALQRTPDVLIAGEQAIVGQKTSLGEGKGYYTYNKDTKTLTLEDATISSGINAIQFMANGSYTINLAGTNQISNVSSGIVASNVSGVNNVTVVLSGSGSLDISANQYAIDMQVGNLKFENTGEIKLTTGYVFTLPLNALRVKSGSIIIDNTKYDIVGVKQDKDGTREDISDNPNLDTILKGTSTDKDLYFKSITITPAAAKPSTIRYNGTTLKQGETITDGNGGTATVDSKNNTITLKNFNGTAALSFDATLADSTLVLEGTNTLSSIVTTQMGLTISGSGSLTVGSIRVPNNTQHTANLTINGGAHVTVNRPSSEDEPAVEVSGNLTVTGDGTQLSAECTAATNPAIEVGGNVTISGNPGTDAYTVKAYNKYATQRGRDDKLRPSQMPSAIEISGDSLSISNSARVMAKTDSDGAAVWMPAQKVISVVDASLIAQNSSHNFSTISFGDESNMGNIYSKGQEVNIVAENMLGSNSSLAHKAIKAFIYNHYNTGDSNPYYIKVVSEGVQSGGNVNVIPGHCTSTGGYKVTITRGDAYTTPQVAANYTIAGQTMYVGKYYKTDANGNITEGTAQDYNIFCDSENDFTLNNATISSTGTGGSTGVIKTNLNYSSAQFHIKLIGTNSINNAGHHAILGEGEYSTIFIENAENASNASLTISGNFLPVYSFGNVTINAEVVIINTNGNLISTIKGGHANGAFDLGSGYKCYASTSTTGNPLEEFNSANYGTYKYLCVTKENLAPTTPTTYTVTITAGDNMKRESGALTQEVTKGAAITEVKFMAASGHYFPADYVSKMNLPAGLTAEIRENSWYLIISGTPTSDVTINLPAASVRPTITVSMPTPVAGYTPATASDITLTYSDINKSISKNLTISNVVWQSYVSNGDGSITPGNTLSSGDKFEAGKTYFVRITHEYVAGKYDIVPAAGITLDYTESDSTDMMLLFYTTGAPCNHEYTNDWHANGNTHWHECKLCRAHADEVAHTFGDWITDTPATDTTDGSKHRTCSVCQYKENATIPKTGTGEIVPPTPDNPGTIVIIRPAEEEKPAQQPNPSTGANDLVGLAVAAAVAAALGSAALLRKHD